MKKKLNLKFLSLFMSKSIQSRMIRFTFITVFSVCVGLALTSFYFANSALKNSTNESLSLVTKQAAATVTERVDGYFKELQALSDNNLVKNVATNKGSVITYFNFICEQSGFQEIFVVDENGNSITREKSINIADTEYFKKAISGQNTISDPLYLDEGGEMQVLIAVPIEINNVISRVLVTCLPGTMLSDIIADISYAKTGYAFMINSQGTLIAHDNYDLVLNMENNFEKVKTDSKLAPLVALEKKMVAGENGVGMYSYSGETKFMGYHMIDNTNWSLAVTAPQNEVFALINTLGWCIVIASIIFLAISFFSTSIFSASISNPIKQAAESAKILAKGDFTIDIPEHFLRREDEIGTLAKSFKQMTGNLNNVLTNIRSASDQVSSGSRQVSDSSMALSQGATEQASSIEELSASIEEISSQTKQNAENSKEANELAASAKAFAAKGNSQMQEMLKAMNEINSSSNKIAKIIKVIDEIAFQTNILALNAAVEAARAGQYGKGFAVVAEEVRNLAARSANAAKETTAMIETSTEKVSDGTKIANETWEALRLIVEKVDYVASLVGNIAVASNEQALGIGQINQAIMQVSSVVQANSAISEESAASSEELSSQAKLLKEQVDMFKLKKDLASNTSYPCKEDIDPFLMKMFENETASEDAPLENSEGALVTSGEKKINLSNNEFGKY